MCQGDINLVVNNVFLGEMNCVVSGSGLDMLIGMKTTIEQLVHESFARKIPEGIARDVRVKRMPGKASVLVGMRRSGKTWLCFEQMRALPVPCCAGAGSSGLWRQAPPPTCTGCGRVFA